MSKAALGREIVRLQLGPSSVGVAACVVALLLGPLARAEDSVARSYRVPRTAAGTPDLQGTWSNASLTNLERPAAFSSLVVSEALAQAFEQRRAAERAPEYAPARDLVPPSEAEGENIGGEDGVWTEFGSTLARIGGAPRTSWLVDPPNGKLPFSSAGRARIEAARRAQTYDGPEARPASERCLVGAGTNAGPPMLHAAYNNNIQILQTPTAVVILVEMVHDARIIRLDTARHLPPQIRPWMGDSVGHWDGDILVVETTNLPGGGDSLRRQGLFISEQARVVERFRRVSATQILYEFDVDDPTVYTRPWTAQMAFNAAPGALYEFACHEGNYSLPNILGGARRAERLAGARTPNSPRD